jgi:nucleoside-diphosphate-sugar epimerase
MKKTGKKTILLTGATGFLGSHLMAELLQNDYEVIIFGRSTAKNTLQDRLFNLMKWFGLDDLNNNIKFVEVDFAKDLCGLSIDQLNEFSGRIDEIIHCVSDTSFSEKKRDLVFKANVHNLTSILDFAKKTKIKFFHYISTAYVNEVNVYEESKLLAEKKIREYCYKFGIPFSIIRPSIVYGNSKTGRSIKFNALYFPVKSLYFLKEIYMEDIRFNDGLKSSPLNIHLDENDVLNLPISLVFSQKGLINLIPIDYFVAATMKIIENAKTDTVYHLTNDTPATFENLLEYSQKFFKLKGLQVLYGVTQPAKNPPEELINKYIEPYLPYLSDKRSFDRKNTDFITKGLLPPEFSYDIFARCMQYALDVDWGRKLSL